mmetsp:Transcript_10918/g.30197  ORF Transcript_10918/g.30197 Transcript_10918/m.30197 type:complete len:139 (-) Transcript_10918:250-666(-)
MMNLGDVSSLRVFSSTFLPLPSGSGEGGDNLGAILDLRWSTAEDDLGDVCSGSGLARTLLPCIEGDLGVFCTRSGLARTLLPSSLFFRDGESNPSNLCIRPGEALLPSEERDLGEFLPQRGENGRGDFVFMRGEFLPE